MRRKLIQLAQNTLVVSIPTKWIKKTGLKKGDEIIIKENEKGLTLESPFSVVKEKKIVFDSKKYNIDIIKRWILSSLHKQGFDEIEILYKDVNVLKEIQNTIKELYLGFIILEQTNSKCVLKCIAQEREEEFYPALRRAFVVVKNIGDRLINHLKEKEKENLDDLILLDSTVNQLTNFCERLINKRVTDNKNSFYYVICWNLEKVSDNYTEICSLIKNKKVSKKTIELFEKVQNYFSVYSSLVFNFDDKKLITANENKKTILKELNIQLIKGEDVLVLSNIKEILVKTSDFSASIVAINLKEEDL